MGNGVFDNALNRHLIGGHPSQLKLKSWLEYLRFEEDFEVSEFIYNGIRYGFAIVTSIVYILNCHCLYPCLI